MRVRSATAMLEFETPGFPGFTGIKHRLFFRGGNSCRGQSLSLAVKGSVWSRDEMSICPDWATNAECAVPGVMACWRDRGASAGRPVGHTRAR